MRKSFKKYSLVLAVIFTFVNMFGGLVYSASPAKGFQVTGSALYDANGNQFIIRGVNHAHTWYKDQLSTVIPALAKAGCNTVRIVLSDGGQWTEDSASSVANIISLCEQNKIVAVLEVHDATGKDEQTPLLAAANYFAKIKDALIGKEDRVIINIANEWTGTWNSSNWAEGYKKAIPIIRNAGLTHTIMVDAGGWGQYGQCVKDYGKDVFNSDTLKNTIFSIHMYGTAGKDASTIKGNIDGVINQGLALCIGEFGWNHSDGDVDEATIMSYCKEKNVGWMAWSWKGNGGGVEYLDLSNDWTGTSLSTWGDTIVNGTNGLKETSKICSVFGSSNNTGTGMRDITAFQLVNEMSVGWNLGNTFDAPTEIKWGNPVTTKAMIDKIKQQGFNTLRLPVTWDTHLGATPNYTIDPAWIKRVEEVANYALDNNMYVILNLHHEDTWIMPTYANQTKISDELTKVWTQIANHFKNYGDHLIFETMNEPRLTGSTEEWTGGTSEGRDVVNKLNVVAVSTIRATGGNNEKRFIMAPTYAASTASAAVNDYKLPNNDSRVIVSLHMYSPYFFAMDAAGTSSWGSDNDKYSLKAEFDAINTRFIKNGMAVVIGEFGTIHKNNESSRVAHAEYFVKTAKAIGITCCWWDNGYFKAGAANSYEIFNRSGLTWQEQSIADALIKGAGSTPIKVIPGDVNKDNQITIIDALLLKKYILRKATEKDLDMTAADYNKDSNVNSIDYLLLKQALMQVK